jgi:hypothetical protein
MSRILNWDITMNRAWTLALSYDLRLIINAKRLGGRGDAISIPKCG